MAAVAVRKKKYRWAFVNAHSAIGQEAKKRSTLDTDQTLQIDSTFDRIYESSHNVCKQGFRREDRW